MLHWNARQESREWSGVGCGLREHAPAIVSDGEYALFGRARDTEAALHSTQDRHATVQPAIDVEVPCRYQQQTNSVISVLAAQFGEIHVLTNAHTPSA